MTVARLNPSRQSGGATLEIAITIKVDPGEYVVTARPEHILVTVLGSCVAACIRDPVAALGGMNHFMLPTSEQGEWAGVSASARYGNFAMEKLINDILKRGGMRRRLEAKLFGGATMIGDTLIGGGNVDFVEDYLRQERIQIIGGDMRGRHARRVRYAPVSGRAFMSTLPRHDQAICRREVEFASHQPAPDVAGSVELF